MYPSVKDLDISNKRKKHVIKSILDTFFRTAISRRIVRTKHEDLTNNFSRLGLNLIVDKIWFVDLPVGETTYAYQNIGYEEGKAIALSETKMVIESILHEGSVAENFVKCPGELDEKDLQLAISLLRGRVGTCDAIVTNVKDVMRFWLKNFRFFLGSNKLTSPFGLEGYFQKIPVYWSNFVPERTTIALNKNVGKLSIKKEITADILEIQENEYDEVLKSIKDLDIQQLKEKVRLIVDEIVSFKFKCKEAVAIVKYEQSEVVS